MTTPRMTRLSRRVSRNSLRKTTLARLEGMGLGLVFDVEDDLEEGFFEGGFAGGGAEVLDGAFGGDAPAVDDGDLVAEALDFGHDVGGVDDGEAFVAALLDEGHDGLGGHDVEAGGRLVEDHDGGAMDDGAGDGDALLLSGGELVAATVLELGDFEALDEFVDAGAEVLGFEAVEAAEVFEHLAGSEASIEGCAVGEEADAAADFLGLGLDVEAGDGGAAEGGLEKSAEEAEGGGLASAVSPEETEDFAGSAGEGDAVDGADESAFTVAEGFGEVFCDDHDSRGRWSRVGAAGLRRGQRKAEGAGACQIKWRLRVAWAFFRAC